MSQPGVQPKWKVVEYSRSQIINAGKTIRRGSSATIKELQLATEIIDNWRAAHAFPLHVIYMHLRRMRSSNNEVIVAERLKRLDSIIGKLKREQSMNLWTMQDLGGCRVIVPSIDKVYECFEKYDKSRKRHIFKKSYDYIKVPKDSGYRSLHAVYEYHSDKNETYNKNMLVEIQFRTHLQHLWATAVETMGLFTKESIKTGAGSDDVKRFFVLTSALFAKKEQQPLPPNVIDDLAEIVSEINTLNRKHNYLDFLSGISVAVDNQKSSVSKSSAAYYILILNYSTRRLQIKSFKASQFETANAIYNSIEATRAANKIDAVLVRVSSFTILEKAYPNYFSDIWEFVDLVRSYLNSSISKGSDDHV